VEKAQAMLNTAAATMVEHAGRKGGKIEVVEG
jgi:hypothetical protein